MPTNESDAARPQIDPFELFNDLMQSVLAPSPAVRLPLVEDDAVVVTYQGELDLRRQLALIARAYGWLVEEEVVVPGWGRIDLVLRDKETSGPILVELKLDLTRPALVRKAFQQADGYGRWWASQRSESCRTELVAVRSDADLVAAVHAAYPEVGFRDVPQFMRCLATWDAPSLARHRRARARTTEIRTLLALHDHALSTLSADLGMDSG